MNTELRNLPAPDSRKATDSYGRTGDSGSDQGKQEGAVVDRCSRARPRPHPLKVAMDEIQMRERFGPLYEEIFGRSIQTAERENP